MIPSLVIVIPVFNRKHYAAQAIESIRAQICPAGWRFHVVVVDDGSTDGTADFLRERFAETDSRVTVLKKENAERGAARNFGARWALENLTVGWFLFFDSDDFLLPGALGSFARFAGQDCVAVYGAIRNWDGGEDPGADLDRDGIAGDLLPTMLRRMVLPLGATFVRAEQYERVGGFPEVRAMSGSEDWVFLTRVALGGRVEFLGKVITLYRQHAGNTLPTQTLRAIDLAVLALEPDLKAHFGTTGETAVKKFRRLACRLKMGALNSAGYPWLAARLWWKSGAACDQPSLRTLISVAKKSFLKGTAYLLGMNS